MEFNLHIEQTVQLISQAELVLTGQFLIGAVLALLFGYVIGWERKRKEKPAGIVTHSFVILGAMVFTMLSQIGGGDPTRIAAAVVTGIGFLGAGMILKSGDDKVENLTTAAGIWLSSAIGVTLGFKLYLIAFCIVIMMFCARFLPGARH